MYHNIRLYPFDTEENDEEEEAGDDDDADADDEEEEWDGEEEEDELNTPVLLGDDDALVGALGWEMEGHDDSGGGGIGQCSGCSAIEPLTATTLGSVNGWQDARMTERAERVAQDALIIPRPRGGAVPDGIY